MKANKCDRCEEYYTYPLTKNHITAAAFSIGSFNIQYDLCNKCVDSLVKWWKGKNNE